MEVAHNRPTRGMPEMSLLLYPSISQMMRTLLSSPQLMKQIIGQNPQLHNMFDSNPELSDMIQNHEMIGCGDEVDEMMRSNLKVHETNEETFSSVVWIRDFNINEPIYLELYHEFYSTYEFNEVCADDELQSKKIIKFRLGGRAHSLTLLEFARRLGLYHASELDEEGFDVYFQGGLRSDENFNAPDYWDRISTDGNLQLSRSTATTMCMFEARHQNGYANVAWLIAKWMKRKGVGSQKNSWISCGQFITKIARKSKVLIDEVVNTLSAPVYCRNLDRTTLRELIDSEDRLIPDISVAGVPRAPRSYHWDIYHGVFEHMAGMYEIPLGEAYNPPGSVLSAVSTTATSLATAAATTTAIQDDEEDE
ncbi:reverse transcriptase domain-containing protein [Tanacetum coccineum]